MLLVRLVRIRKQKQNLWILNSNQERHWWCAQCFELIECLFQITPKSLSFRLWKHDDAVWGRRKFAHAVPGSLLCWSSILPRGPLLRCGEQCPIPRTIRRLRKLWCCLVERVSYDFSRITGMGCCARITCMSTVQKCWSRASCSLRAPQNEHVPACSRRYRWGALKRHPSCDLSRAELRRRILDTLEPLVIFAKCEVSLRCCCFRWNCAVGRKRGWISNRLPWISLPENLSRRPTSSGSSLRRCRVYATVGGPPHRETAVGSKMTFEKLRDPSDCGMYILWSLPPFLLFDCRGCTLVLF